MKVKERNEIRKNNTKNLKRKTAKKKYWDQTRDWLRMRQVLINEGEGDERGE